MQVDPGMMMGEIEPRRRGNPLGIFCGFLGAIAACCCIGVVSVLVGGADVIVWFPSGDTTVVEEAFDQPGVESATIIIDSGSPDVRFRNSDEDDTFNIVGGRFESNIDEYLPATELSVDEGRATVTVDQEQTSVLVIGESTARWDFELAPLTLTDIQLETSSGDIDMQLSDRNVRLLRVDNSSGEVDVRLGGMMDVLETVRVRGNSGNTDLRLTEGTFRDLTLVRAASDSGNVEITVNSSVPLLQTVEGESNSGNVTADLRAMWEIDARVFLRSNSGNITLRLPDEVGIELRAESNSGNVTVDGSNRGSSHTLQREGSPLLTINLDVSSGNITIE